MAHRQKAVAPETTSLDWVEGNEQDPEKIWRMFKGDHGLADAEDGITFDSMETSYRSAKAELTFNKYYHVFGYTRFESDNDDKSKSTADSGPGVWYDEDMNLPPVGQSVWTKNEDEAVKFLWE